MARRAQRDAWLLAQLDEARPEIDRQLRARAPHIRVVERGRGRLQLPDVLAHQVRQGGKNPALLPLELCPGPS